MYKNRPGPGANAVLTQTFHKLPAKRPEIQYIHQATIVVKMQQELEPITPGRVKEMYLNARRHEVSQSTLNRYHYCLK